MNDVTPRLISVIVYGESLSLGTDAEWISEAGREFATKTIQALKISRYGVDFKPFLLERYVEGKTFDEIAAARGRNREWARQRVARALRLARGKLMPQLEELSRTIKDGEGRKS